MTLNEKVNYTTSNSTVLALFFFLVALLFLLFILYKYLNKKANGKYTVERIVFREGGLRDRARGATMALGNRLGVQLWPQSDTDWDEENEEHGEEEEEKDGEVNSNKDDESEDENEQEDKQSDSAVEMNHAAPSNPSPERNSVDSADEEQQPLIEPEPESKVEAGEPEEPAAGEAQEDNVETSGPIVININQFSGSVQWSEEGGDKGPGDVTAL